MTDWIFPLPIFQSCCTRLNSHRAKPPSNAPLSRCSGLHSLTRNKKLREARFRAASMALELREVGGVRQDPEAMCDQQSIPVLGLLE